MIGKTISHFKILKKLGEGGMGVVYKAEDTRLDRFVELKFLPSHLTDSEEEKQRFIHEAKSASALEHPNITTIHEIDEVEDPTTAGRQLFIAMECVEGETLKDKVEKGPLKTKEFLNIAISVADGLNAAHEHDIVHRDIKSENIMISKTAPVKIMDFGLAKRKGMTKITKTGSTLGTVAYMSPEQTRGGEVDRRSDLFSFGVVMYEMATGQLPFKGEYDSAIMYAIVNEAPLPVTTLNPNVPKKLGEFIHKALEKEVEERYQHADDLLADLRRLKKEIETRKTGVTKTDIPITKEPVKKPIWRQPAFISTAIIAIILLIYGVQRVLEWRSERLVALPPEKSIAVLPFDNLTGDASFDVWRQGMPQLMIEALSSSPELHVVNQDAINSILGGLEGVQIAQITPSLAKEISRKADAKTIIKGNILKARDKLRLQVHYQDGESGEIVNTQSVEGTTEDDFFALAEDLSDSVRNYLEIEILKQDADYDLSQVLTTSAEAYRYYLQGMDATEQNDWRTAVQRFTQAASIDTNFMMAHIWLAYSYNNLAFGRNTVENMREARKWADKAYRWENKVPYLYEVRLDFLRAEMEKKPYERIKWAKKLVELDPQHWEAWFNIGYAYWRLEQYNEMIEPLEKAMELAIQWGNTSGIILWWPVLHLSYAYHELEKHDQELHILQKNLDLLSEHPERYEIFSALATAHLCLGDTANAQTYLTQLQQEAEKIGWPKAAIASWFGQVYDQAGKLNQAEEYYRQSIAMESKAGYMRYTFSLLAYLLIENDRDVEEGIEIAQRGLEIDSEFFLSWDALGWGYYKQGKYELAVEALQKTYDLMPQYFEPIPRHLEMAQAALAEQE